MQVFIDYLGELNVLAVVIAALAAFVSGAIWYAEAVFGKQWKKAVGLSDKQLNSKDMRDVMGLSALSVLVSAVAMALLVKVLVLTTVYQGALFGAMIAIGILGMKNSCKPNSNDVQ